MQPKSPTWVSVKPYEKANMAHILRGYSGLEARILGSFSDPIKQKQQIFLLYMFFIVYI